MRNQQHKQHKQRWRSSTMSIGNQEMLLLIFLVLIGSLYHMMSIVVHHDPHPYTYYTIANDKDMDNGNIE